MKLEKNIKLRSSFYMKHSIPILVEHSLHFIDVIHCVSPFCSRVNILKNWTSMNFYINMLFGTQKSMHILLEMLK